jgi:hypothetical protein
MSKRTGWGTHVPGEAPNHRPVPNDEMLATWRSQNQPAKSWKESSLKIPGLQMDKFNEVVPLNQ